MDPKKIFEVKRVMPTKKLTKFIKITEKENKNEIEFNFKAFGTEVFFHLKALLRYGNVSI